MGIECQCGTDCTGGCTSCSGYCTGTCSDSCKGGCGGNCEEYCSNNCGNACYKACSSCATNCGNDCHKGCADGCKGGCGDGCQGCTGACQTVCSTECERGCNGCTAACRSGCDSCTATCKNDCTGCFSACKTYCNSGCSTQAMSGVYNNLSKLSLKIVGSEITDLRTLLLHELDRFGITSIQSLKSHSSSGNLIKYGEIEELLPTNVGIEINNNVKSLLNVATTLLSNSILSNEEMSYCLTTIKASYNTVIGMGARYITGEANITRRSDGSLITETDYDPWTA